VTLITPNATKVTREELSLTLTPPSTDTHCPIPHRELIAGLEETPVFRHIGITDERYELTSKLDKFLQPFTQPARTFEYR